MIRMMNDMSRLALQTDSTRVITLFLGSVRTPGVDFGNGRTIGGYHNISHHGKDEAKLKQLAEIEIGQMELLNELLQNLKDVEEADGTLLDHTMVLYGCHMGDANIHNNKNLPVILAGGGFKHGQHLAFSEENNTPLANLYVSMLENMGLEKSQFASSTGTLTGLKLKQEPIKAIVGCRSKMNTQNPVITAALLVIQLLFVATVVLTAKTPNVLFLISDDLNTALSGFGHPQCKTPELDKLAKRGMRFENMHCQYPVCGASRASLMSGLYPYTNGTLGNAGTLRGNMPDVVTMSQLFRNNGYRVGRVSKIYHMGIPPEILDGTALRDDPHSWDEVVNIKAPEQNAPGEKTNWSPKNKSSQSFTGVVAEGDDLVHADGMAATHAIDFLKRHKEKPFFPRLRLCPPPCPIGCTCEVF